MFATAAVGSLPDTVHALVRCRGDINESTCLACATGAFLDAQQLCAYNKDATVFYNLCALRYSNQNFSSAGTSDDLDDNIAQRRSILNSSASTAVFDAAVGVLLNTTAIYAATKSATRFGTGVQLDSPRVFSLAECTPNLTPQECERCLTSVLGIRASSFICSGAESCIITSLSCGFAYHQSKFFSGSPLIQQPPAAASSSYRQHKKGGKIVAIILLVVAAVALAGTAIYCYTIWSGIKRRKATSASAAAGGIIMQELLDQEQKIIESHGIDLQTLQAATRDFHVDNKLGQGGFGTVYKGILPDNQQVAVKRLSQSSRQGINELKNELFLLAKLQHRNLVTIVGVCLDDLEKLIVYEFLPNSSLDHHIYDAEKRSQLDLFKIIDGIARGLQYLHEGSHQSIVHRDLKSSNVLLGNDSNPKISDFGLARIFWSDKSHTTTLHAAGTSGYMAPEYAINGYYSTKSDVYSFGILLLEILTGKPADQGYLLFSVWEHWIKGTCLDLLVGSSLVADEAIRCIKIALLCVQDHPAVRPSMSTVVIMLNSSNTPLAEPLKPYVAALGLDSSETASSSVPARRCPLSTIIEMED